jgi:hypothetical protein
VRTALAVLFAACCVLLHGCAWWSAEPPVGYNIRAREVVFRFEPSQYVDVTRDDTGSWRLLSDIEIEHVSVAGAFNEWSKEAWPLSGVDGGAFELRKSRSAFAGQSEWSFKFVVNGFYWVEPPPEAPNCVRSGEWDRNRSRDLILRVP